jgi:hypothetical protein
MNFVKGLERSKVAAWAFKAIFYSESHAGKGWDLFWSESGGRALSFHDLSVGEAPAPLPQEAENGGGGKFPSQISRRKDQPGRLGTQGKVPALSVLACPMRTLLNDTKGLLRPRGSA